jgi:hypothetical protein
MIIKEPLDITVWPSGSDMVDTISLPVSLGNSVNVSPSVVKVVRAVTCGMVTVELPIIMTDPLIIPVWPSGNTVVIGLIEFRFDDSFVADI